MAKKIHQFIGVEANKNILTVFDENDNLIYSYFPVCKLGIQAPSDVSFFINEGTEIVTGPFGIYELDISDLDGQIFSLVFNDNSNLEDVIVNIIYDSLEGGVII